VRLRGFICPNPEAWSFKTLIYGSANDISAPEKEGPLGGVTRRGQL